MRLGALFTGGKDSTYSLFLASKENEISCLINADSENKDSYMFHTVGSKLLDKQAESLGIPLERFYTKGEKEMELTDMESFLKKMKAKYHLDGIVSGAIASRYQKSRVDNMCEEIGMKSIAPIWGVNQEEYLRTLLKSDFKIIIIKVAADGLGKDWLGRILDESAVAELVKLNKKFGINVSGEGGEYESLVIDCPIFENRIEIGSYAKIWNEKDKTGYLEIQNAILEDKH